MIESIYRDNIERTVVVLITHIIVNLFYSILQALIQLRSSCQNSDVFWRYYEPIQLTPPMTGVSFGRLPDLILAGRAYFWLS